MKHSDRKQVKGGHGAGTAGVGEKPKDSYVTSIPDELMQEALEAVTGASGEGRDTEEVPIVDDPPAGARDGDGVARQELAAETARLIAENAELKDRALRAAADLENYRKRALRDRDEFQKFAIEGLLRDLLPVADNVDQAVLHLASSDLPTVRTGVEMTYKSFLDVLKKKGVTPFTSTGEPFDPNMHEAVQMVASTEVPAGRVVSEVRRGYMIHDRLLRAAMVVVSTGAPKDDAGNDDVPEA